MGTFQDMAASATAPAASNMRGPSAARETSTRAGWGSSASTAWNSPVRRASPVPIAVRTMSTYSRTRATGRVIAFRTRSP